MTCRSIYLLCKLLIILFIISACNPAQTEIAQPVSENVAIIFISDRDGKTNYYRMAPDGTNINKISFGNLPSNSQINGLTWSLALEKFTFGASTDGLDSDIYIMNEDGSELTNLTNDPGIYESDPVISPDGQYITFVGVEIDLDIFIIKTDGSGKKNLTMSPARDFDPQWTPDSKGILFSSNQSGTPNIYSMDLEGKNLLNISQGSGMDANYHLSQDGKWVVFDSDRTGNSDIFVVDSTGNNLINLTNSPYREVEPLWSPNGQWIAFRSDQDGIWNLCIMKADGSQISQLTKPSDPIALSISWAPDNQRISFSAKNENQMDVFIIPIDGSIQKNITDNPANDYGAFWITTK